MVEAPLFVRHYLASMSRSGLFVLMCSGMATIAGTVLFIYASLIGPVIEGAAGHLLVASVISAPAAVMIARIMVPGESEDAGDSIAPPRYASTMDAITQGTQSGLSLYLNIVAMLLVLVALVKLGAVASIEAGPAAVYFAAVVVITMIAAESFDPRLIWDALEEEQ